MVPLIDTLLPLESFPSQIIGTIGYGNSAGFAAPTNRPPACIFVILGVMDAAAALLTSKARMVMVYCMLREFDACSEGCSRDVLESVDQVVALCLLFYEWRGQSASLLYMFFELLISVRCIFRSVPVFSVYFLWNFERMLPI